MSVFLNIAEIVLAAALILAVIMQIRGGGLGGIFGQPSTVYRTRRGMEKVLLRLTIALAVLFIVVAMISLKMGV